MTPKPIFPLDSRDVAMLASHLERAAGRGEPLDASLRLMARAGEIVSGTCARHCELLAERVAAGDRLSAAMASFPRSFSAADVALVAAGEDTAGDSRDAMAAWARVADQRWKRRRLARRALWYPAIVVVLAANTLVMRRVLEEIQQALISSSDIPIHGWPTTPSAVPWATAALLALPLALALLAGPWAPAWIHRAGLALPLAGEIARRRARCTVLDLATASVRAGADLADAFSHAGAAEPNRWLARDLRATASRLREGEGLPSASAAFDRASAQALRAALASPDPASSLRRLADTEGRALTRHFDRFAAIAPSAAILLAGIASGIVIAMAYSTWSRFPTLTP